MRHASHQQKINATISKTPRQRTAFKSALTALVASLAFIYSGQVLAHGGEVHMVPLEEAMSTAGMTAMPIYTPLPRTRHG